MAVQQLHLESLLSGFQPNGISYHLNDLKTILIITDSNDKVFTFLGDLKTIVAPSKKVDPLKKNLINVESSIRKVVHTKLRSYCLHEDGCLSLFASYKQIKRIKKIIGCRDCFTYNDGIALLIKEPEKNLTIEFLPDVRDTEKNPKIIDCGSCLDNESFSLTSIVITDQNVKFLTNFLRLNQTLDRNLSLLMFSVGNNIFVVEQDNVEMTEAEIRSMRSYSSKVMKFYVSKETPMLVSVLISGVIEVSYLCPILNLVTHKTFQLFDQIWCFSSWENSFFYSDGLNIYKAELTFNKNEVEIAKSSVELPGVVGITYVKEINKVFCVTENRCLYQVTFSEDTLPKETEFLMVNDHFLIKAKSIQKRFQTLLEHHQKWQKAIDESKSRHQALQNYLNDDFPSSTFCTETIPHGLNKFENFANQKQFEEETVPIIIEMNKNLLISYPVIENSFLMFEYGEDTMTKCIIPVNEIFRISGQENHIKYLILIRQNNHLFLPDIKISFLQVIRKNDDFLMLKMNVKFQKMDLIKSMILNENDISIGKTRKKQSLSTQLKYILETRPLQLISPQKQFSYRVKFPFVNTLHGFELSETKSRSILTFFGREASVELKKNDNESQYLMIASNDVGLLSSLKSYVLKKAFGEKWKIKLSTSFEVIVDCISLYNHT